LEYFDEGNIKSIMLREWLDVLLMIRKKDLANG